MRALMAHVLSSFILLIGTAFPLSDVISHLARHVPLRPASPIDLPLSDG